MIDAPVPCPSAYVVDGDSLRCGSVRARLLDIDALERIFARLAASALLAMVKPQFEVGRHRSKGGIVRSAADRREAIVSVARSAEELGLRIRGMAYSGLPGPKGNRETFVWAARSGAAVEDLHAAALRAEP